MTRETSPSLWRRLPWWGRSSILSVPQVLLVLAAFVPSIIDNQDYLASEARAGLNLILLLCVIPIAVLSIVFTARGERERLDLDRRLALLDPSRSLERVTTELFKSGGWRLSLFAVDGDVLTRRHTLAVHNHWRESAPDQIRLSPSPFKAVFERNLASPHDRLHDESSAWAGDTSAADALDRWRSWQATVFGEQPALAEAVDPMMTRKYAWYAIRDSDTQLVWAVICESMAATGINVEFLSSRDTAVWVLLWARMLDAAGR